MPKSKKSNMKSFKGMDPKYLRNLRYSRKKNKKVVSDQEPPPEMEPPKAPPLPAPKAPPLSAPKAPMAAASTLAVTTTPEAREIPPMSTASTLSTQPLRFEMHANASVEGFPSDSIKGLAVYTYYKLNAKYTTEINPQEAIVGGIMRINEQSFDTVEAGFHFVFGKSQDIDIAKKINRLSDALDSDNLDDIVDKENEVKLVLRELADSLGNNYYFNDNKGLLETAFFIGVVGFHINLMGWDSQLGRSIRAHYNLFGIIDRFYQWHSKDVIQLKDYDKVAAIIMKSKRADAISSSKARFFVYTANEPDEFGLQGEYFIKTSDELFEEDRESSGQKVQAFANLEMINSTRKRAFNTERYHLEKNRLEPIVKVVAIAEIKEEKDQVKTRWRRCLILPYYSRGALENKYEGLDLMTLLNVFERIFYALSHMHANPIGGVVHNDISTNNICLDEKNQAFLIDLGLSGFEGEVIHKNPGVYQEECDEFDCARDIYSMGLVGLRVFFTDKPVNGTLYQELQVQLEEKEDALLLLHNKLTPQCTSKSAHDILSLFLDCRKLPRKERPKAFMLADRLRNLQNNLSA